MLFQLYNLPVRCQPFLQRVTTLSKGQVSPIAFLCITFSLNMHHGLMNLTPCFWHSERLVLTKLCIEGHFQKITNLSTNFIFCPCTFRRFFKQLDMFYERISEVDRVEKLIMPQFYSAFIFLAVVETLALIVAIYEYFISRRNM